MKDLDKNIKLDEVTFFLIEKANKTAKRYSTKQFKAKGVDLTVDQWLVLKKINDEEEVSQLDIAQALFKDTASITRILDLLDKKGLVERKTDPSDRRKYIPVLTKAGKNIYQDTLELVVAQRKKSLEGLTVEQIEVLRLALRQIIENLS